MKNVVVFFTLTDRASTIPSNIRGCYPVCSHKEVPRSTGHIMVATRYSDQQRSKSRQKVMRLYKRWHRLSISRAALIDSECCRLPTTSVLSNKSDKYVPTSFDQRHPGHLQVHYNNECYSYGTSFLSSSQLPSFLAVICWLRCLCSHVFF